MVKIAKAFSLNFSLILTEFYIGTYSEESDDAYIPVAISDIFLINRLRDLQKA